MTVPNPNQATIDQLKSAIAQYQAAKETLATQTAAALAQYQAGIAQMQAQVAQAQAAAATAQGIYDAQIASYQLLITQLGG